MEAKTEQIGEDIERRCCRFRNVYNSTPPHSVVRYGECSSSLGSDTGMLLFIEWLILR
jgi:hypothetical protein